MTDVGKFFGNLVHCTAILYIPLPFGIFYGHFGIFSRFGMLYREKSGNPVFKCKYTLTFEYWYLPTMTPLTKLLRRSSWTLMT
jgi:hypothetical protein